MIKKCSAISVSSFTKVLKHPVLYFESVLTFSYSAYDGAYKSEEWTNGAVKFLDLTSPQYGLPVFDYVFR